LILKLVSYSLIWRITALSGWQHVVAEVDLETLISQPQPIAPLDITRRAAKVKSAIYNLS
jgi:hypothetical protein